MKTETFENGLSHLEARRFEIAPFVVWIGENEGFLALKTVPKNCVPY